MGDNSIVICFFLIQGGFNFSSAQSQSQASDNRTIRNFVKAYVDEFVGGYSVAFLVDVMFLFRMLVYRFFFVVVVVVVYRFLGVVYIYIFVVFKVDSTFPYHNREHRRPITTRSRTLSRIM